MGAVEAIGILLFVAPGLAAVEMRRFFAPVSRRQGLEQIAEAVLYSGLAYLLSVIASWSDSQTLLGLAGLGEGAPASADADGLWLVATAFITAVWLGAAIGHVLGGRRAATIAASVANRTIVDRVWEQLFHALATEPENVMLECELRNGTVYRGTLDSIGSEAEDRDLVLAKPNEIRRGGVEEVRSCGKAVLIRGSEIDAIRVISFDPRKRANPAKRAFVAALLAWPALLVLSNLAAYIGDALAK